MMVMVVAMMMVVVIVAMMVVIMTMMVVIMTMMIVLVVVVMMVVTVIVRMVVRLVGHQLLRLLHSPPRYAAGQSSPALVALHRVRANRLGACENEPVRTGQRLERAALQGVDPVGTDRGRSAQQDGFVHEVSRKQRRGKDRPGLDHQPRDAALGEGTQHGRQVEPAGRRRHAQDLGATPLQGLYPLLRRRLPR